MSPSPPGRCLHRLGALHGAAAWLGLARCVGPLPLGVVCLLCRSCLCLLLSSGRCCPVFFCLFLSCLVFAVFSLGLGCLVAGGVLCRLVSGCVAWRCLVLSCVSGGLGCRPLCCVPVCRCPLPDAYFDVEVFTTRRLGLVWWDGSVWSGWVFCLFPFARAFWMLFLLLSLLVLQLRCASCNDGICVS